ncbi:hypothetical protein GCM10011507_34070 [Edaphobacter acidisoli]|uniref:PEP-CTERM protein-sorting domain-containing protein n=1 Tax=Edaphobacter acidisoli TaxID=2040573 RepID=A0A916S3I2_9BACT|nr:PEP-CTERM sorting domain-containing protein [Edaphobacter acidisoli]GGA79990.1 hypothetical protein GCM10011507_34070 [Edaphobacter acidisoli]
MNKARIIIALFGLFAALAIAPIASADPVSVSGSGTWDAATPTTAYSVAGASWYFSFNLPDPIASNPSTQVTNFTYDLNGSEVINSMPGGILFYSVADGGGFDLFVPVDSSSGASIISLYFPDDVGSDLSLAFGNYSAEIGLNDSLLPGSGEGNVNITPEPSSIILLGTALLMGSALIYRCRTIRA